MGLCPDFPLQIIEHAAEYAEVADRARHHFLGESEPFGDSATSSKPSKSAEESTDPCTDFASSTTDSAIMVFASLQRLVEFCFVYSEVLRFTESLFEKAANDE